MSADIQQSEDQVQSEIPASPERPPFSPLTPEKNERNTDEIKFETNDNRERSISSTIEIKSEPTDNAAHEPNHQVNITATDVQSIPSATESAKETITDGEENLQMDITTTHVQYIPSRMAENVRETPEEITSTEPLNVNVFVKDEPFSEEIDYNMPISKTPLDASVEIGQFSGMNRQLGSTTSIDNPTDNLDEYSAKAALDKYMDGIETPIAPVMPRLRVKTEFALQKLPQSKQTSDNNNLNKDPDSINKDILPALPPPTFSSNSNSDFVTDGIATPRISLASINRLRVKSEFSLSPSSPQNVQENSSSFPAVFSNDLSDTTNPNREGEVSPSLSDDDSEDEPIPNDFFDDLLRDKAKERIEEAQNCDLEEKYSDRLRELERLRNERKRAEKRKNRKKQKKSKKKSRKRSRSRSLSPNRTANESNLDLIGRYNYERNKRSRLSPPRNEMPSSSHHALRKVLDNNLSNIDSGFKIKSEFPEHDLDANSKETANSVENIEEVLTPKQKREIAIKRSTALLNYLKLKSDDNSTVFSTFPFVSTVRKLPTSISYVQQKIYENRSPLHTVNNVSYKFNSHTARFNMVEWGLSALPPIATKMAKLVGCDAQFIYDKLKTIKIPAKLKNIKQESNKDAENENEEELIATTSSLFSNAMTQTDDISEFTNLHNAKGYEIGVQVEPSTYSIGCQTLETQSPTKVVHKDDEAPIMKLIRDLNENQLMAIHAFTEFIKEPNTSTNGMEMYKTQMKILDIYKMSQMPSLLVTAQPPIVNNYTTMKMKPTVPSQLRIQSVKGADGKQFSVNDPRAKSDAYSKRINYDDAGSSSNIDSRHTNASQYHGRLTSNEGFSQSSYSRSSGNEGIHYSSSTNSPSSRTRQNPVHSNQVPPTTAKHYGRGALRR